jgi:hypothetical protein
MSVESGNGFDRWLEQQLQNEAAGAKGPSPAPAQATYHAAYLQGGLHMSVLAKVAALVSVKGAIGVAAAMIAVAAAGAATEATVTGSANPNDWGQQVVQQVAKCKAALTPGSHGIGQCVSAFAKQHGPQVSADHRASGARENGNGNGNQHTPGPPSNVGKPSSAPGKPSDTPHGPPTTHP